ncbi:MAG: RhuM [Candidatus Parcubacteria bacterium]|jgi:predicted transcriptional regulator
MKKPSVQKELVIFTTKEGQVKLRGDFDRETIWATQAEMAEVFGVSPQNITMHLRGIYKDNELDKEATCKESLQVQLEGNRTVRRTVSYYNLDVMIAVGYRINSVTGTKFRQWATKTLREHITKGFTINPKQIKQNHEAFLAAVEKVKKVLPATGAVPGETVLDLVSLFADTWFSLDAYDKESLVPKKPTKKKVALTADALTTGIAALKTVLMKDGTATANFAQERNQGALAGIVGNIMQTFGGNALYPTIEGKAAHLLYFIIKNHPFVDGNKRSGAYAFVWFLERAKVLEPARLSPTALTALTILIAESSPKDKDKIIDLVTYLITIK